MLTLVNFLTFSQEIVRVPLAGRRYRRRVPDHALLIDNHRGAVGDSLVFQIDTVLFCHLALGMEILQERKGNPAGRFCPIVMRKSAINAHTHNLGVTGLELVQYGLQAGNLSGSSGVQSRG